MVDPPLPDLRTHSHRHDKKLQPCGISKCAKEIDRMDHSVSQGTHSALFNGGHMAVSVSTWGRGDNFIARAGVVEKDDIESKLTSLTKLTHRLIKYKKKTHPRKAGKKEILVLSLSIEEK